MGYRRYRRMLLVCTSLAACAATAEAHGLVRYASTPISPPGEFLGMAFVSIGLLIAANFAIFRWILRWSWLRSAVFAFSAIATFFLMFAFVGIAGLGLGPPCATLYGLGWKESWRLFTTWNIVGIALLLSAVELFAKPFGQGRRPRLIMGVNLAIYLVCLTPYAVSEAYLHGWGGFHVTSRCSSNLRSLIEACGRYADDHDGKLPGGETLGHVFRQIRPYIDPEDLEHGRPLDICPMGTYLQRYPKRYGWNKTYSGRDVRVFEDKEGMENNPPFTCPYHGDKVARMAQWDLDRAIKEMLKSAEQGDVEMRR